MTLNIHLFTPEEIMADRADNKVIVADFKSGQGKYVTTSFDSGYDMEIEGITPRISLRIKYILNKKSVVGLKIAKTGGKQSESITLSIDNIHKIVEMLSSLISLDLDSIANSNLIINDSIIDNSDELKRFLKTVAADKRGIDALNELIANTPNLSTSTICEISRRKNCVELMSKLLDDSDYFKQYKTQSGIGKDEQVWQKFFEKNSWILGSDIIRTTNTRSLDEHNITDIPFESFDGFMDIVELKLPSAQIWSKSEEPSQQLTAAIMQCMRYVHAAEIRSNDRQKCEEIGCNIVKPRAVLIYGRSATWNDHQFQQFRILNDGLSNITIMTYDQVLRRANSILNLGSDGK